MAVKVERQTPIDCQTRDEAFTELYEGAFPTLVGYCRGLLGPGGDAEGIAQEAFLRAWVAWDRYGTSRPFWALVATIARNLCMDHHRHERVVVTVLENRASELIVLDDSVPDEHVERGEEYRWAREALSQLRPNHQRLLRLREVDGLSCESIAEAEGTTPESVAATLYRARQRLRDAYNRVAAGALGAVALFPMRQLRRRSGLLSHVLNNQMAVASPAVAARAGEVLATAVALAVVTVGAPASTNTPTASDNGVSAAAAASARHVAGGAATSQNAADAARADGGAGSQNGTSAADKAAGVASHAVAGVAGVVTPQQTAFTQVVAPSGTSSTGELFGVGTTIGCTANCAVLFHSADGGASWAKLPAVGFTGGTLLLPPSYPNDKRMFAAGPTGLLVSPDGGAHFTAVAPVAGAAAMSPAFSSGDPRILLGAVPGWEYHDDVKAVVPLSVNPPPSQGYTFAFVPGGIDPLVLVGAATTEDGDHLHASQVVVCHGSGCDDPVALPGGDGVPNLLVSRSISKNGVVFAWTGDRLFRSTDGATTFGAVTLPARATINGLAEAADGTVVLALAPRQDGRDHTAGGLYASQDEGRTWHRIGDSTPLAKGVSMVGELSGGRLLAAPASGGVLCSTDVGRTWAATCLAPPANPSDHGHHQAASAKLDES